MPRRQGGRYKHKIGRVFDADDIEQHALDHHGDGRHKLRREHDEKESKKQKALTLHTALLKVKQQQDVAKRRAVHMMLGTSGKRMLVRIYYAWRIGIMVAKKEREEKLRYSSWTQSCIHRPGEHASHFHCDAHELLADTVFQLPFDVVSRQVLLSTQAKQLQVARASSVPVPASIGLGYSHPALPCGGASAGESPPRVASGGASLSSDLQRRPHTSPALPGSKRSPSVPQIRVQRPASSGGQTESLESLQRKHEELQLLLQAEEDAQRGPPIQMATEWHTGRRTVFDHRRGLKLNYSAGVFPELAAAEPKKRAWW